MEIRNQLLDLVIQIQQIPAPTFDEGERTVFIRDQFINENLTDVEIDPLGNVYARLPGEGDARPVVVTAHSDTVFPRETDLEISRKTNKIFGPGIGDNSLGVAGLFGLLWALKENQSSLPGDLWLVANVCEEGLGDLKGIRGVVDRFCEEPLAYIILEGMAYGEIFHHGLGVQRYQITAYTEGGAYKVDAAALSLHGFYSGIERLFEWIANMCICVLCVWVYACMYLDVCTTAKQGTVKRAIYLGVWGLYM